MANRQQVCAVRVLRISLIHIQMRMPSAASVRRVSSRVNGTLVFNSEVTQNKRAVYAAGPQQASRAAWPTQWGYRHRTGPQTRLLCVSLETAQTHDSVRHASQSEFKRKKPAQMYCTLIEAVTTVRESL